MGFPIGWIPKKPITNMALVLGSDLVPKGSLPADSSGHCGGGSGQNRCSARVGCCACEGCVVESCVRFSQWCRIFSRGCSARCRNPNHRGMGAVNVYRYGALLSASLQSILHCEPTTRDSTHSRSEIVVFKKLGAKRIYEWKRATRVVR